MAGEYAVASELCRRGHYAQLTLGHHKKTDLLVEIKSIASGGYFVEFPSNQNLEMHGQRLRESGKKVTC